MGSPIHDADFVEGKHVVVIDDEPDVAASIGTLLETAMKVSVSCFESGEAFLDALPHLRPDLVLTDYKLPGIDGIEVLARVAEHDPDVPRALFSAFADLDVARAAVNRSGAAALFTKPVDSDELLQRINDLLVERHMQG